MVEKLNDALNIKYDAKAQAPTGWRSIKKLEYGAFVMDFPYYLLSGESYEKTADILASALKENNKIVYVRPVSMGLNDYVFIRLWSYVGFKASYSESYKMLSQMYIGWGSDTFDITPFSLMLRAPGTEYELSKPYVSPVRKVKKIILF